jgi:hypothetical protein
MVIATSDPELVAVETRRVDGSGALVVVGVALLEAHAARVTIERK